MSPQRRQFAGLALALVIVAPAWPDSRGEAALAEVEAALFPPVSTVIEYAVVTQEPGKSEHVLSLRVGTKGEARRYDFLAPPDMKDVRLLFTADDKIYAYLPAFGKVRRLAAHSQDQSFMGLAFSQDDLAPVRYSRRFTATIIAESPTGCTLALALQPGQTAAYARIEMEVSKEIMLPIELRYYDEAGTKIKTETRRDYASFGNIWLPGRLLMVDHLHNDGWTRFTRTSASINAAFAEEYFSKVHLAD
jgi:hypothetical protein